MFSILTHCKKNCKETMKRYALIRNIIYTYHIIPYIFLYGIIIVISIVEPYLAEKIVKYSIYSFNINLVVRCSIIWLVIFLIKLLLELKRNIMNIKYDIRLKEECQTAILEKILNLKYKVYSKESDGYWMSRCVDDVNNLDSFMPNVTIGSLWSFIQFIFVLAIMINMNWKLTIIAVLFIIGDVVANCIFPLTKYYKDYAKKRVLISHELSDILKNVQLIKCSTTQEQEIKRFDNVLNNVYDSFFIREKCNCLRNWIRSVVGGLSAPIFYLLGGLSIINGSIGIDVFISFMMYFGLLKGSFSPISVFFVRIKNANVYIDRINEILNLQEEDKLKGEPIFNINNIVFNKLNFFVDNNQVLNNISFSIGPNEKIAIMGESGCGKSSLIKMLLGLNEISSGQILINGISFEKYCINDIRERIAYISQNDYLFNRSIDENLNLWDKKINLKHILELTMCNEFINAERNLKSNIDGHSNNFSGGEKQRLSIARQLIKNADVYIFDEATSALDKSTEKEIFNNLMLELKEKIVIFISHNPQLIKEFSKIIFISEGKVIAVGSHSELMNTYENYKRLYNSYLETEKK